MSLRTVGGIALRVAAMSLGTASCGQAQVSLLTYNVAGLPQGLSASNPAVNTRRIAEHLNAFDIAVVQEDFAYHDVLSESAMHAYREPALFEGTKPYNPSGLARFSTLPMRQYRQTPWSSCNGIAEDGSDCLAPKGFSVAEHEVQLVGTVVTITVYNVHMDSGESPRDDAARIAQVDQLLAAIAEQPTSSALIVAGDTNVETPSVGPLGTLERGGKLIDVCSQLGCSEAHLVDRVFYRSSDFVRIEPLRWRVPTGFVDDADQALSDHVPVAVEFAVSIGSIGTR